MARLMLEQLSDFRDYTGGQELTDIFNVSTNELKYLLSNVRLSPEGRHLHVILRDPQVFLVTFDKNERTQVVQNQKELDLWLKRTVPVVDVLYLEHGNNRSSREAAAVAVVYEDGKAEFWRFKECKDGWQLLYTSNLCNSPRARVVSVCACSNLIIWCEERPPSESSPTLGSTKNKLTYCVCRREFTVQEAIVSLGGVKIALHNNPKFRVVSSGDYVYLLPDLEVNPLLSISTFFLSWSPFHESFTISTTCKNAPLKRLSSKESDFKRMLTDCLGYLSTLEPPEIYAFSPTGGGGLLLLLSTRWVCLLRKEGALRQVYKLADNCLVKSSTHTSLCLYEDTLALLIGQNLYLVDVNCGRELQKISLKREGLLYVNRAERCTPHILSDNGLFVMVDKTQSRDYKLSGFGTAEIIHPGARLVEAVFEEACKYYQQRSLSRTQLTVDALKKGGRFQAPISLASILRNYLSKGSKQKEAELFQNGDTEFIAGQDKLMDSLEVELKVLVSLEEVKGHLLRANEKEVEVLCESLVEKEVARLLSSAELDKEALLHLNFIFSVFPSQVWRAAQAALQLHHNGESALSSSAPPDVWKTVLSPAAASGTSLLFTNGRQQRGFNANHTVNWKPESPARPAALPVFELLCESILRFKPDLLPRFLELAQRQQGSAGLGLSLASSSWSFPASGERGGGSAEKNTPLYKRTLSVLYNLSPDTDQHQDLEVELLLVSGRPTAILQALRILMAKHRWDRVTQVAQEFCQKSPLLNKEIFTTLLCEVTQHRDLDPYLDLLWCLCPDDFTVTTILNLVLKNLPSPNNPSSPASSTSSASPSPPPPFAVHRSSQLTIGLLKPLLRKVLQRESKPNQCYADILQSPSLPPPVPPRLPTEQSGSVADPLADSALDGNTVGSLPGETPGQQTSTQSIVPRTSVELPANLV